MNASDESKKYCGPWSNADFRAFVNEEMKRMSSAYAKWLLENMDRYKWNFDPPVVSLLLSKANEDQEKKGK